MTTAPITEHRKAQRRRVLKSAMIAYNNRHSTLPCVVRDMSDSGAKLIVSGSINAPDTFELLIEIDGIVAPCQVIARRGDEVRVKFTGPVVKREAQRAQVVQANVPKSISIRRKPVSSG